MPKLHFTNCGDCGQPIIRRGSTVLNTHGTPLNHALSCAAKPARTPRTPVASGDGISTSTQGDDTMTAPSVDSFLIGSGAKSAKFENVGAVVGGKIVDEPQLVQQKDIKTGAPKHWDDGNPMMHLVVKVQTDERDPDDSEDDGVRAIYIKAQMRQAVADAVRKAGAKSIEVGGELKVKFTGTEPSTTKGFNDKKIYAAQYTKPAASNGSFLGTDDDIPF